MIFVESNLTIGKKEIKFVKDLKILNLVQDKIWQERR